VKNWIPIMWTFSAIFSTITLFLVLVMVNLRVSCEPAASYWIPSAQNVEIILEFPSIENKAGYIFEVDGTLYLIYGTENGVSVQRLFSRDSWMETNYELDFSSD